MRLVILTGASGSGKTAIAQAVRLRRPGIADVLRFDQIGVPSTEEMVAGWGSGEAWQRAMTLAWMARIVVTDGRKLPVLFEGQMRLAFVREGLVTAGINDARTLLVDCDDRTRAHRLIVERNQPELASPTMMSWAAFLRREAQEVGCEVLDTSKLPLEESVAKICEHLATP
jgi:predicted kinase